MLTHQRSRPIRGSSSLPMSVSSFFPSLIFFFLLFSQQLSFLNFLQGICLIYIAVQLIQKVVKRELEWSILTLILVFVGLCCIFRILEIAIDPENFLNILTPGARFSLLWLVISCLVFWFFSNGKDLLLFCFVAGLPFWICRLYIDFNLMVSLLMLLCMNLDLGNIN